MKKSSFLWVGLAAMHLIACNQATQEITVDETGLQAMQADRFAQHVQTLSSDEFQGRKPFTKGDTLTVNYLVNALTEMGLQPGNGNSYTQDVPMSAHETKPTQDTWSFQQQGKSIDLRYLEDFVVGSKSPEAIVQLQNTPLVFAGFGIVAPEFGWNDYEGLDAKDKIVVVMVNDPGFYDKTLFKGDTMTYYGRWTYKFEEAARQGAAGVLIIHDTGAASYDWSVVRGGWSGPRLGLAAGNAEKKNFPIEGWISTPAAEKLFAAEGGAQNLFDQAKKQGFKPIPTGITTSLEVRNTVQYATSSNVVAKIEGTKRPDEYIIYTAHWDHMGIGEPVNGDSIFNGAIDNALGVAGMLELAQAFKASSVAPERSILFLFVTAEEQGLLGSKYYAENPIYPLNKTVANINLDAFSPTGKTKDMSVVGLGHSELDDYLQRAAAKQGRVIKAGGNPSAGSFFRSDHFNFAKVGVPALYSGSGSEFTGTDTARIQLQKQAFSTRYHQVTDHFDDLWDFDGILENLQALFDVGYTLSMESHFPKWKAHSEFKEVGEKR
jgi:Zn-dependent M28 family amino/carboxypeptidase